MKDKKKKMGSDPFGFIGAKEEKKTESKKPVRTTKLKESNKESSKYKHTDIQTKEGKISEVGERATFYVKPDLLTEIKIISIRMNEKNVSELVNEAIEDLIDKYKKNP